LPSTDGGADELRRRNGACSRPSANSRARKGLPGRPWFRHLVYAPLPSYAAETLPGVREAILEKDAARASAQAAALAQALRQAADRLEAVAGPVSRAPPGRARARMVGGGRPPLARRRGRHQRHRLQLPALPVPAPARAGGGGAAARRQPPDRSRAASP
jgi:hypothetical protein